MYQTSEQQLRHYLRKYREETGQDARGILVHGGTRKLSDAVRKAATKKPLVEIVQYKLDVDFAACT